MGSTYGNFLKLSLFGESHGSGVGVVLDGFPAGLTLDREYLRQQLARRAPGGDSFSTKRREADSFDILSGLYRESTTGAPICAMTHNTDTHSEDYDALSVLPRPSHADFTGAVRYQGMNDPRGGGHFSGRLTAPLVFAGTLCRSYLKTKGILIGSHLASIAGIPDSPLEGHLEPGTLDSLSAQRFPVLDEEAGVRMREAIETAAGECDSVGGVVECGVLGLPAGLGSPIFENVESRLAAILFGIPGVKGVEFGGGFGMTALRGSEANDPFVLRDGKIETLTNRSGGIQGGITNGMPVLFRVAMKPTASIFRPQRSVNLRCLSEEELVIKGRHDPCIAPRAAVVIESACAVAILDLYLEAKGYENA